jgi:hypothetical protein
MKNTISCFLCIICMGTFCFSQQAISTAGGEATGTGGTVNYTVGQITYHHFGENGSLLAQGIQQPYEILIYSGIDISGINLHISVYPNPVQQHLKLTVTDQNTDQMSYQIYDLNGRLLAKKMLDGTETNIRMDLLAPSVYYLQVHDQDMEIKTFKIIKY